MIDHAKLQKIIAALSVSMEAMNASNAEAVYAFAYLHRDAMKRFMGERIFDTSRALPTNVLNITAMSQHIDKVFTDMGLSVDEFADKMVGEQVLSEGTIVVDPDSEFVQ